jgi:hypothetical protein
VLFLQEPAARVVVDHGRPLAGIPDCPASTPIGCSHGQANACHRKPYGSSANQYRPVALEIQRANNGCACAVESRYIKFDQEGVGSHTWLPNQGNRSMPSWTPRGTLLLVSISPMTIKSLACR